MCQIPAGRPLTSSYVWHFFFLITSVTNEAFTAERQCREALRASPSPIIMAQFSAHNLLLVLLEIKGNPCSVATWTVRFLTSLIVFFFFVCLFTGGQGQPGKGPIRAGGRIRRGGEGGGADQHRGQRGHHQGSGVELR